MHELSRRHFAQLLGTAAALAAVPHDAFARSTDPILLNSNENPYGPSPAAMRAMRDAMTQAFRYPDDAEDALRDAIANLHGLTTAEVLLGNGSSDLLQLAAAAFPGKLVTADPTFESLWVHARGSEIVKVPLTSSYAHDLPAMLDAARDATLVYICNPNNPTATITPKESVRTFLNAVPASTVVLVDEAYHHYAESPQYESVAPLVASKPNLIVARTFSKIYAMAGVRCGYALANKELVQRMAQHQPFNAMNLFACVGATASLADTQHALESKKKNRDTRAWLASELRSLGYSTLPSDANFVMIELHRDVKPVIAAFRERGLRVGRLFPALPQNLRVTLGTRAEMERFLGAFREITAAR